MKLTRKRNWMKCVVAGVLAFVLTFADVLPASVMNVQAAETTITSMAYFGPNDGPTITHAGIGQASFGFVMPIFNGGESTFEDVVGDLGVNVKVDGNWEDIDDHKDKYTYNSNWGHWYDSGFTGYWFVLTENTYIQLYSKTNPSVTLEYNLIFNTTDISTVTALAPTFGTNLKADRNGTAFINYPNAVSTNGTYPTGALDLDIYVKPLGADDSKYVNIDNNAASGWIYDNNFGSEQYGYWFVLSQMGDINVKLALKENPDIYCEYSLTYEPVVRTNYKLYAYEGTTIKADSKSGAAGMVFPCIGGSSADYLPTEADLAAYVVEFYKEDTGEWVPLGDSTESNWYYEGNGYVDYSSKNQWGYFFDYVYGLWFQPITEDFKMRVGYPEDGVPGGEVNGNYIEFNFIGAPNAYRPEDVLLENIEIDETDKSATSSNLLQLDGWTMIFNEEFDGTEINENYWTRESGYFSEPSNPDTWGWGNNELESYTDSPENSWVSDGALHLKAVKGDTEYEFDTDGDGITDRTVTSTYQSGKLVSRDKVKFTYGRVDFRAKLPAGVGLWPATWMMPNDDVYGTWACSGEIDVMEVRGRVPNESTGAIHFGGMWPSNRYASPSKYTFPEGTGVDDGYHTYSVVWEEDYIAWYVDGNFFQYVPSSTWYTTASSSETAPFDQHFYLIMNLALGGWFDNQVTNDMIDIESAEMLVDFVRVYQVEGEENYVISEPSDPVAIEGLALNETEVTLTEGESVTLKPVYTPANTTDKGVTWLTSDVSVATVNNGKVTALKEGTVTITATSTKNPELKATATVTVEKAPEIALESLSLSKTELTLTEGNSTTLKVTYKPTNTTFKDVTWKSSNEKVATVVNGKVTAVAEGEAVITVTSASNDNISASCTVKVEKKQAEPIIPSTEYGVQKNADGSLTFWVRAEANKTDNIFYYGKNKTNPRLSDLDGYRVTADAGDANYYTYTIKDTFADTDTVSFLFGYYPIGSVGKTDSALITLTYGDIPSGTGGGDEPVKPSDVYGATQNEDGSVTFWVQAADPSAYSTFNTVYYVLNNTNPELRDMMGFNLTADAEMGENYYSLTVSKEDLNYNDKDTLTYMFGYVPVNGSGRTDSPKTTITLIIEDTEVAVTGLKLDKATAAVTEGESTTLTVSYEPGNTTQTDVVWSTSDENIATVENGVVTAVARGTVTITVASASNADIKATCTITVLTAGNPFGDVKETDWYYKYAKFAYDYGLMSGKGTTADGKVKFDPANNMTRAEFVQMLYAKEGKPAVEFRDTFTDVKEKDWFASAVIWANQNGIVAGTGDKFDVNGNITRQEMAAILYKYAGFKGYDVSEKADITSFVDDETVSSWAVSGMQWAVQYGVVSGKAGNELAPLGNATRAEAATMMRSFMVAYEGIEK